MIACVPDEEAQRDVMSLIYDDIKGGKTGDRSKFERAYRNLMGQGCDAVILAVRRYPYSRNTTRFP